MVLHLVVAQASHGHRWFDSILPDYEYMGKVLDPVAREG
jgi:hypothetical protein